MTRIRRMLSKEILMEPSNQLDQPSIVNDESNVPLSRAMVLESSGQETVSEQRKRKKNREEKPVTKKPNSEWKPEDYAKPVGDLIKTTGGKGKQQKCHYQTFEFHQRKYELEDSVMLFPKKENQMPYIAIIKDIYVQGKERYVELEVQWLYRPGDVEKKYIGNWDSNDARFLFYSFHRDVVTAESVKRNCVVHFVPADMQIPDPSEYPGYIVQNVYDIFKKKLRSLDYEGFNEMEKIDVDHLVAKTIQRIGDHYDDIVEEDVVPPSDSMSMLMKFEMLTGDLDRDNILEELLESVKKKFRITKMRKANYRGFVWPDDVVHMVGAVERVCYDSLAKDMPDYTDKMEVLVEKLENSGKLAERLIRGELKVEQVITMTNYELMSGHTFGELVADIEEPVLKINDASTSKSV